MTETEYWDGYTSFVLILSLSLHFFTLPILSSMPIRPLLNISQACDHIWAQKGGLLMGTVSHDSPARQSIMALLERSLFILPQNKFLFGSGFKAYLKKKYYLSLVFLLPAMEHSLRRIYVSANCCPNSYLTAGTFCDHLIHYTLLSYLSKHLFLRSNVWLLYNAGCAAKWKVGDQRSRQYLVYRSWSWPNDSFVGPVCVPRRPAIKRSYFSWGEISLQYGEGWFLLTLFFPIGSWSWRNIRILVWPCVEPGITTLFALCSELPFPSKWHKRLTCNQR